MKRIAALTVAAGLFSLSTLTAWMTREEAVPGPRGKAVRGKGEMVKKDALPVRTPQDWRAQFEKSLAGSAGFARGPFSREEFKRLWEKSFEWGEEQTLADYAEAWVRHDAAGARAWLESQLSDGWGTLDSESVLYKSSLIFDAWAKVDLEAALAAAPRLYQTNMRCQALAVVLRELWKSDPDRAQAVHVQNLEEFAQGSYFDVSIPDGEAGKRYLGFLQSLSPGGARAQILASALDGEALSSDRSVAVAFWKTAPAELQRELLSAGFLSRSRGGGFSHYDPYEEEVLNAFPGVAERWREQAELTGSTNALNEFVFQQGENWIERDLPGFLAWVQQYGRSESMRLALSAFEMAGRNQFDTTLSYWQEMPEGELKYKAIGVLYRYADEEHKAQVKGIYEALTPEQKEQAGR